MELYCGIDLHSRNGVYFVTSEQNKTICKRRLPNRLPEVLKTLEPFRNDLKVVAVESTYNWYWLVDGLVENGYPVSLVNPSAVKQYSGLKEANDWTDAGFLAHLARLGCLPTGYIYPKEDRPVRDLLRRRMLFVKHRTALILSVQNMICRQSAKSIGHLDLMQMDQEELLGLLDREESLVFVAQQQLQTIDLLSRRIVLFDKRALSQARAKPSYRLLLTMPGVGEILGLTILYETGDIHRFAKASHYTSYCRAVKATRTSNGKKKGYNNRKNGNRYLAWAFIEAVHHAIRCCQPAKAFYERKRAKVNGALASKALASKWSKAAYYIMTQQKPFDLRKVF